MNISHPALRRELDEQVRPLPDRLQPVNFTYRCDTDERVNVYETSVIPARKWANSAVAAQLENITAYSTSRYGHAWRSNNELISRVDEHHRYDVPVEALQVIRQLHADLNNPDVEGFMDSYAAFTLKQRFNLAGYDGKGRETGKDMLYKAHHPTGLFKAKKTRERLAELARGKPMTDTNTFYTFSMPYFQRRLNDVRRRACAQVLGVQDDVTDFEIQKLGLILGGATPEHVLRADQGHFAKRLTNLLEAADDETNNGSDQRSALNRLDELQRIFDGVKSQIST